MASHFKYLAIVVLVASMQVSAVRLRASSGSSSLAQESGECSKKQVMDEMILAPEIGFIEMMVQYNPPQLILTKIDGFLEKMSREGLLKMIELIKKSRDDKYRPMLSELRSKSRHEDGDKTAVIEDGDEMAVISYSRDDEMAVIVEAIAACTAIIARCSKSRLLTAQDWFAWNELDLVNWTDEELDEHVDIFSRSSTQYTAFINSFQSEMQGREMNDLDEACKEKFMPGIHANRMQTLVNLRACEQQLKRNRGERRNH